jgi:multimeric flavodoxin WrbA
VIAIVYHSASGRTKALAEAVARGAGDDAQLLTVDEAVRSAATLAAADAIVLGCPTYMGSASAAFKAFMDSTAPVWALEGWRDKIAAGFTHSAAPSGDKLGTLVQLAVFAAQHGMIWVGLGLPPTYAGFGDTDDTNRLGSHLGAMAQSRPGAGLPDGDLRTAEHLGRRVAEAVARWGRRPRATTSRHSTTATWAFPPDERAQLPDGIERTNLREIVARRERFEHHLIVCAAVGSAQLEITAASEPLYFGHINISDEYALALPTGDDLIDRFPLRTFVSDPATGSDLGRYNHRIGDLVLHPIGLLHWPGRLRPPYAPFDVPPGMRRCGLSLVYCAGVKTPPVDYPIPLAPERAADVKAYVSPAPRMELAPVREMRGTLAAIGGTTLTVVECPEAIAPPRGGWVVVLDGESPHFALDLLRIPPGAKLPGAGIVRALVFASRETPPAAVPPAWHAAPPPPFPAFEDAPPGKLPLHDGQLAIAERSDAVVAVSVRDLEVEVPRYWLARMLFRLALHEFRLGHVETYGGWFVDDHAGATDEVRFGVHRDRHRASFDIPRRDATAFVERLYRAVAPVDYRERLR